MTPAPLSAVQQDALAGVERSALDASFTLAKRDDAIRQARAAGLSLRQIGDAAGMTPMGIRGICEREPM